METYKFLESYSVKEYWQMELGQSAKDTLEVTQEIVKDLTTINLTSTAEFVLEWERAENALLLHLSVKFNLEQECSRCLKITMHEINNSTEYEYAQSVEEDDELIKISSDLTVNLTQPVIDTLVTAIDQFPVCKKSCLGLCPTCGVNLNENENHKKANPTHFSHEEVDNKPKIV